MIDFSILANHQFHERLQMRLGLSIKGATLVPALLNVVAVSILKVIIYYQYAIAEIIDNQHIMHHVMQYLLYVNMRDLLLL